MTGGGRTTATVIRDAALAVLGESGPSASLKRIAERAGVSPPLIIKLYGSRDRLVAAVDAHVLELLGEAWSALADGVDGGAPEGFLATAQPLADRATSRYLSQLLLDDSERSAAAYRRLQAFAAPLVASRTAGAPESDHQHLVAVLLAHELSLVLLRDRLTETLGQDPMSPDGLQRWWTTVDRLYAGAALGPARTGGSPRP